MKNKITIAIVSITLILAAYGAASVFGWVDLFTAYFFPLEKQTVMVATYTGELHKGRAYLLHTGPLAMRQRINDGVIIQFYDPIRFIALHTDRIIDTSLLEAPTCVYYQGKTEYDTTFWGFIPVSVPAYDFKEIPCSVHLNLAVNEEDG